MSPFPNKFTNALIFCAKKYISDYHILPISWLEIEYRVNGDDEIKIMKKAYCDCQVSVNQIVDDMEKKFRESYDLNKTEIDILVPSEYQNYFNASNYRNEQNRREVASAMILCDFNGIKNEDNEDNED